MSILIRQPRSYPTWNQTMRVSRFSEAPNEWTSDRSCKCLVFRALCLYLRAPKGVRMKLHADSRTRCTCSTFQNPSLTSITPYFYHFKCTNRTQEFLSTEKFLSVRAVHDRTTSDLLTWCCALLMSPANAPPGHEKRPIQSWCNICQCLWSKNVCWRDPEGLVAQSKALHASLARVVGNAAPKMDALMSLCLRPKPLETCSPWRLHLAGVPA
jgi:hypothetical protein